MLKGGIFGFGGMGQGVTRHINLQNYYGQDVRIVAVADRDPGKRDLARNDYGLAAYASVTDLIGHGLDFMGIVSTSHAHHEAALACAQAKVPYLIEKPIALTVEAAREIVQTAEAANLITGVNYIRRYIPVYRKMKQLIDSGQLGQVLAIWGANHRGHGFYASGKRHPAIAQPQESGGWIVHHLCHVVDWAIWLAGEVEEVYTLTSSTAPAELDSEELIFSTIKFRSGAIGTLADQIGAYRDHAFGVAGTKGGVGEIADGPKKLLRLRLETDREWRAPHILDPEDEFEQEDGWAHFLRCVKEARPTRVPVGEALYSLEVCHAMRQSAREHRPVLVKRGMGG